MVAIAPPDICKASGTPGIFFPLSSSEHSWSLVLRFFLYGFFLMWCFMGVAIVADQFMGSIEAITSRRKQVKSSVTKKLVTVNIWNPTVANLTLMALGSSAPEILLSVIELLKNGMYSGELGPSTILGSASFNLMVIIGLCVAVIPRGEGRKVHQLGVLYITTVFSLLAYLWMVVTILLISPNVVDIWEAVVTLCLFPLLTYTSYLADIGKLQQLCKRSVRRWESKEEIPDSVLQRACRLLNQQDSETKTIVRQVLYEHPKLGDLANPDLKDIQQLWQAASEHRKGVMASRAQWRQETMRWLTAHKKVETRPLSTESNLVQFECSVLYALPASKDVKVLVTRHGDVTAALEVSYTVNLSVPDSDEIYSPSEADKKEAAVVAEALGSCEMPTQPLGQQIGEGKFIIDDDEHSKQLIISRPTVDKDGNFPDFEVRLTTIQTLRRASAPRKSSHSSRSSRCSQTKNSWQFGHRYMMKIRNMYSDSGGKIAFPSERLTIIGQRSVQHIEVVVQRDEGCVGSVGCSFRTERLSAVPGYDYEETSGTLTFGEGITEQRIPIVILPKKTYEKTDEFLIVLEDSFGGACFDPREDGGCESSILTVTIKNDETVGAGSRCLRLMDTLFNLDEFQLGLSDWKEQFICAIYCNGSAEDQAEASLLDWVFHVLSFPWKIIFAFSPPTTYFAGWPCFWTSLAFIALVTGAIGDLAELFGCVLDVPNAVTALTFVAMGTSMPDLFASKAAATQDATADASICNVTGSNSVNVFLGLGIPWTIGAFYWSFKGEDAEWSQRNGPGRGNMAAALNHVPALIVRGDNLGFAVSTFLVYSVSIISILFARRSFVGCELGGPAKLKLFTGVSFFIIWCSYTGLCCWAAIRLPFSSDGELLGVCAVCIAVAVILWAICLAWTFFERGWISEDDEKANEGAQQVMVRLASGEIGATELDTSVVNVLPVVVETPERRCITSI
eukprot:TRINITY_DN12705_c0_g1_i1.p1 TRINITY_DN12705_c0_g1~~TRINITY_DN12705_c0_g1_i1.p1  ORF type:complete len:959 (-),score=156.91 TRINITY_DN12705_c0_g1_i1:77-2953(-)